MRKRLAKFATAALIAGALIVGTPQAAEATSTDILYVFDNTNYNGILARLTTPVDCDSSGYRWGLGTVAGYSIGRRTSSAEYFGGSAPHCNYMTVWSGNGSGSYSKCVGWSRGYGIPAVPPSMNDFVAYVGVRYVSTCPLFNQ